MLNSNNSSGLNEIVRFDESLATFVELLTKEVGNQAVARAVFVRDARGALSVVLDKDLSDDEQSDLVNRAKTKLRGYARSDQVIRGRNNAGSQRLLDESINWPRVNVGGASHDSMAIKDVTLIDRRVVGADWLARPDEIVEDIPRIAFMSIKGGVGRSTALAICATHLARSGRRVLAVDLDLEAPGLGSILLNEETRPRYGAVDWFIENSLSGIDDLFRADVIGASPVAKGVSVLPAFGTATQENPSEALAKIARATLEDQGINGPIPFRVQVRAMLDSFANSGDYDVILIDGRAGLHETTAAVALASGARILLFGRDEPQTYQGYQFLLAHLDERVPGGASFRERAWFVHARAPAGNTIEATERFQSLWRQPTREESVPPDGKLLGPDDFDLTWPDEAEAADVPVPDDEIAVLKVLEDTRFQGFDPLTDHHALDQGVYGSTFGDLLGWLEEQILDRAGEN